MVLNKMAELEWARQRYFGLFLLNDRSNVNSPRIE